MPSRPKFDALARADECLAELELQVLDEQRAVAYCRSDRWRRVFRPALYRLVGPGRKDRHPVLSGQQAFDIASACLFGRLPMCGRGPTCPCQAKG